jgi:hypothetical protein
VIRFVERYSKFEITLTPALSQRTGRGEMLMMRYQKYLLVSSCIALLLTLVACQPMPSAQTPRHSSLTDADLANLAAPNTPQTVEQALGSDPCSVRLQDIEGALMLAYAMNRQLPPQLQDLRSGDGTPLMLTCPTSGRPYFYSPQGLFSAGRSLRIVVWDDAPVHNGYRWCIFMAPAKPGELAMDVKPIPESLFKTYVSPGN